MSHVPSTENFEFKLALKIFFKTLKTLFKPDGQFLIMLRIRPVYAASLTSSPGIVKRVKKK